MEAWAEARAFPLESYKMTPDNSGSWHFPPMSMFFFHREPSPLCVLGSMPPNSQCTQDYSTDAEEYVADAYLVVVHNNVPGHTSVFLDTCTWIARKVVFDLDMNEVFYSYAWSLGAVRFGGFVKEFSSVLVCGFGY